jgi:hypothetical protein
LCRKLLFNRDVERVRMTKTSQGSARNSITYRLEQRDSCPPAYRGGTSVEIAFRDRLVAGDCLISEAEGSDPMDATISLTTLHHWQLFPVPPDEAPSLATIQIVKRLIIEQRSDNGTVAQIALRNQTTAETFALPFYFGYEFHMQGGYNGQTIGRSVNVISQIDLTQALRDTFGFKTVPIEPPAPESASKIADRVLSLPLQTTLAFTPPQQEIVYDLLVAIKARQSLSDDDVDLVRRVIADTRITEDRLGPAVLMMIRKHQARLESLVPVIVERLKLPVPESAGQYQNSLGWAAASYAAEVLLPYRDQIDAIVEEQDDWTSTGLLTRVGELGGDTSGLIARKIGAKSEVVRRFAAVAACRASDDVWAKVRPIALAHLEAARSRPVFRVSGRLASFTR